MNSRFARLQPYPFEKLRDLVGGLTPPAALAPIRLSIGEPQHAAPAFVVRTERAFRRAAKTSGPSITLWVCRPLSGRMEKP